MDTGRLLLSMLLFMSALILLRLHKATMNSVSGNEMYSNDIAALFSMVSEDKSNRGLLHKAISNEGTSGSSLLQNETSLKHVDPPGSLSLVTNITEVAETTNGTDAIEHFWQNQTSPKQPEVAKSIPEGRNFTEVDEARNATAEQRQKPEKTKESQQTPESEQLVADYAYAFVIGGCNPEKPNYRGFLYNILVSARLLKEFGSKADVVAFFQISNKSKATKLPEDDIKALTSLGVKIRYVPKAELESFYDTVMNKFRILQLTQYRRVLLLDGDVMPIGNMDFFFTLSAGESAVLRENVVVNGPWEPANGGWFILEPGEGRYEAVTDIIRRREENSQNISGHKFDLEKGFGHVIEPPDEWVARTKRGRLWDFHFGFSDQGLLYHYVKYFRKSVSIIMPIDKHDRFKVQNWWADGDGKVRPQQNISNPFANYSRPIMYVKGACRKFLCDFVHFSGGAKPWLKKPPSDLEVNDRTTSPAHLWWSTLKQINDDLSMGLPINGNWTTGRSARPPLGMYATFKDMDKRVSARNSSNVQAS